MNDLGILLRDAGIEAAEDNANKELAWTDLAYNALIRFPAGVEHFTCEQVRAWAEENTDIPTPPDSRACAAKSKLILKIGYIAGEGPQCHKGVKTLWAFNI